MNIRSLLAKLTMYGMTTSGLAKLLGISRSSLYRKLAGQTEFTRAEISVMRNAFFLDDNSLVEIFFGEENV